MSDWVILVIMTPRTLARDPTRRSRILAVAKRHYLERGFRGTRLDEIAAEVGCSKGALYLEFPDKEALLREVVMQAAVSVRGRYDAQVLGVASPLDRLVATLAFAFREYAHEPLFARLSQKPEELEALGIGSGASERAQAAAQIDELAGWITEGIANGEIRSDVDARMVPLVIGILRNAPTHLPVVTMLGASGDAVLATLLDIFRRGLAAPPTETKAALPNKTPAKKTALKGRKP